MSVIRSDFLTPYSRIGQQVGGSIAQFGQTAAQGILNEPKRRAEEQILLKKIEQIGENETYYKELQKQLMDSAFTDLNGVLSPKEIQAVIDRLGKVPQSQAESVFSIYGDNVAKIKTSQITSNREYGEGSVPKLKFDNGSILFQEDTGDWYTKGMGDAGKRFKGALTKDIKETLVRDAVKMGIKDQEGFKKFVMKQKPEIFESPIGQELIQDKSFVQGTPFETRGAIEGRRIKEEGGGGKPLDNRVDYGKLYNKFSMDVKEYDPEVDYGSDGVLDQKIATEMIALGIMQQDKTLPVQTAMAQAQEKITQMSAEQMRSLLKSLKKGKEKVDKGTWSKIKSFTSGLLPGMSSSTAAPQPGVGRTEAITGPQQTTKRPLSAFDQPIRR